MSINTLTINVEWKGESRNRKRAGSHVAVRVPRHVVLRYRIRRAELDTAGSRILYEYSTPNTAAKRSHARFVTKAVLFPDLCLLETWVGSRDFQGDSRRNHPGPRLGATHRRSESHHPRGFALLVRPKPTRTNKLSLLALSLRNSVKIWKSGVCHREFKGLTSSGWMGWVLKCERPIPAAPRRYRKILPSSSCVAVNSLKQNPVENWKLFGWVLVLEAIMMTMRRRRRRSCGVMILCWLWVFREFHCREWWEFWVSSHHDHYHEEELRKLREEA